MGVTEGPTIGHPRFQWLLSVLQGLYLQGFWVVSHEVNMSVKTFVEGYQPLLEVVLMKDEVWNFLDGNKRVMQK